MAQGTSARKGDRNGPYLGGRFLFVPSVERGNGTGHLRRCVDLCGKIENSYILLPKRGTDTLRGPEELKPLLQELREEAVVHRIPPPGRFDAVVFDARKTNPELFAEVLYTGAAVGIDEGGKLRNRFDYLIDTLPNLPSVPAPNICSPSFLDLPAREIRPGGAGSGENRRGREGASVRSVLVTFGGEDPAGLTERTVHFLLKHGFFRPEQITAVRGTFMSGLSLPESVAILDRPKDLASRLSGYDLVCTAFGLTAYEASAAGAAVICVHPSRYHARLGKIAGFTDGGTGKPRAGRFRRALAAPSAPAAPAGFTTPACRTGGRAPDRDIRPRGNNLAEFLASLAVPEPPVCPVCRERGSPAFMRFPDRTISWCTGCGLFYQTLFTGAEKSYGEDYFFSEYREQYGKTYLEDFAHIKELAGPRLRIIGRLRSAGHSVRTSAGERLLDVGCAYGPFLLASCEAGYQVFGIDTSKAAVRYVREQLRLPGLTARFDVLQRSSLPEEFGGRYDVVTMWYVLEHLRDSAEVLQKVYNFLKPGGIFAFSTPNAGGISARRNPNRFFGKNPEDHFTLWSPSIVRRVLPRFGFTVRKIRVTGHHPERFPAFERLRQKEGGGRGEESRGWGKDRRKGILGRFLGLVSVIFRLGDTFEVYAVRDAGEEGSE
jgi:2-polyprenyl-3-methyl-5-hydroxy-6-metoxy-1,4-benzoquinol methylase